MAKRPFFALYSNVLVRRIERPKHLTDQVKFLCKWQRKYLCIEQCSPHLICVKHVGRNTPRSETGRKEQGACRNTHRTRRRLFVHPDVLRAENTSFRRATRNDETDGFLDLRLILDFLVCAMRDTRIKREDHVLAVLLCPPCASRLVQLGR